MDQRELASLAVLGVLAEKESATVDQVHEKLQHNFGRYWGASTGILIPTISQLEEDGRVVSVSDECGYGYKITDDGIDRLRVHLEEPVEDVSKPSFRSHLMMKLGFLHHLPTEAQRDELRSMEDQLHQARDQLVTVEERHKDELGSQSNTGYRRDMIDLRIRIIDAFLDWLGTVRSEPR
jgi:DNA-binding PadR family transcriptional regulator